MYSQTSRPFSQGGKLSQLSCPSSSKRNSKHDEQGTHNSNTQNQHDESMSHYSQDCNMLTSLASQPDPPEDPISSRADAICEENQKIRTFVESSLKRLEKRRIKVINKLKNVEEDGKIALEIHNRQCQKSLNLQMNHEEFTENYQNEMNQMPNAVQKLERTQIIVDYFEKHFAGGINIGEETDKAMKHLRSTFEKMHDEEKALKKKKNEIKLSFNSEMQEIIRLCQDYKQIIMKQRESSVDEIETLALQNVENSNQITNMEQDINYRLCSKKELADTFNNLDIQNKTMNDGMSQLHHDLNEVHVVGASHIQNLKLQLNNEENTNSNLEIKYHENEHCLNSSSTKQKELLNLSNQIKTAVEETTKRNEGHLRKIEECQKQNTLLSNQMKSLAEGITKYENIENENSSYKSNISRLEESIKHSDTTLNEKEDLVSNLKDKIEDSKTILFDLFNNVSDLDRELKKCEFTHEEYTSKLREDKLTYQQERECKMLQNKTMEESNKDLISKLDGKSKELDELKDLSKSLQTKIKEVEALIENCNRSAKESKEKLSILKNEWEDECRAFSEEIDLTYEQIDEYEEMLNEAKPKQEELPKVMAMKNSFEQEIQIQDEKYQKDIDTNEHNLNSKILELDREIDNYTSIMKRLVTAEDEATERIKEDIKGTEKIKMKHEDDLRLFHQQLNVLKKHEENKRNKVVKMEKRLRTINNEIKVTKQDISDAITGSFQAPIIETTNIKRLTTPNSSIELQRSLKEPPNKRRTFSKGLGFIPNVFSQENTKKWVESVPDDDYDFSEI